MASLIEHLEVRNEDVSLHFTCPNYGRRIRECVQNLMVNAEQPETRKQIHAFYGQGSDGVQLRKGSGFIDDNVGWVSEDETEGWDAFFFENTDYPLHAVACRDGIRLVRLSIGKERNEHVAAEDQIIFGAVNFHNQVGRTDISLVYEKNGCEQTLQFTTEVLSYKMDYRTDMRCVIRDIEEEFAMLSYSFLKDTYLTFSQRTDSQSTDLIWWQVFRDCFARISEATHLIISNPKRRLQTAVRYERAERMPYMPAEFENEYEEFKGEPSHLYRMEEMYLSKDTVENRFLKYALHSISGRFKRVKRNVESVLRADNVDIRNQIHTMEEELEALVSDPFFRGIGAFRGFSQDSLVMKQAAGYCDVYEQWIILQCGYDLQEGIMQLEVKDISELYEIWCFIRVKNMVHEILKDRAVPVSNGKSLTSGFVRQLVYGAQSEVKFIEGATELASVMYNAQTEEDVDFGTAPESAIKDTRTYTTVQRPDIVLRLSKTNDSIQYTYLFDAKYRIQDYRKNGVEVPPPDAIDQMHRYRDAIYYSESSDNKLKKEVIGGFVLYPGNLDKAQYVNSYYHKSISQVGIGAFPLKPGKEVVGPNGSLMLNPNSSEQVLYDQIKAWINDEQSHIHLLESAIPQRGLKYESSEQTYLNDIVLVGYIRRRDLFIDWIKSGYYVIRRKSNGSTRKGEIAPDRMVMNVQHILLYSKDGCEYHFEGLFDIKDPNSIPDSLNGKELVDSYQYPDKSKTTQDNYLLYSIDSSKPSILSLEDSKCQSYISGKFTEQGPLDGSPVFMSVKELLTEMSE